MFTTEKLLSRWANDILQNIDTTVNYELPCALMNELSNKEDTSELLAIVNMKENTVMFCETMRQRKGLEIKL